MVSSLYPVAITGLSDIYNQTCRRLYFRLFITRVGIIFEASIKYQRFRWQALWRRCYTKLDHNLGSRKSRCSHFVSRVYARVLCDVNDCSKRQLTIEAHHDKFVVDCTKGLYPAQLIRHAISYYLCSMHFRRKKFKPFRLAHTHITDQNALV